MGARAVRLLVLAAVVPLMLASAGGRWSKVAEQNIAFARALTAEGFRFDAAFRARIIDDRLAGCSPRPSRVRDLSPTDLGVVQDYCARVCEPWHETWAGLFATCDRIWAPGWCKSAEDDEVVKHVGFAPYFETLAGAVRAAGDPLERSNIMEVLVHLLDQEVLRHHPTAPLDAWVSTVVAAYLERATPDEVVRIANPILGATFGHGSKVAHEFVTYRDRPGAMTDDERCAVNANLERLDHWTCGAYSGTSARHDEEAEAAARARLQASVMTPRNLDLLVRRLDEYHQLDKEEDCAATYGFLSLDYREGGYEQKGWIRTCRSIKKAGAVIDWRIEDAVAMGDRVKVNTVERSLGRKGTGKGEESTSRWEEFWVFEEGTWNYALGVHPSWWNDKEATVVQLPERASQDDRK